MTTAGAATAAAAAIKLQLSIWAEDLASSSCAEPDPFAVVTIFHKQASNSGRAAAKQRPTVLDQTEVIPKTPSPDWTKLFPLEYNLGKPLHVCISIYDASTKNKGGDGRPPLFLGSAVFEIGTLLGTDGSIQAKQVRGGGIVVAHVESRDSNAAGSLHFQLRGVSLKSTEGLGLGLIRKSDPFYELQRLRKSVRTGARVWDTVFRSMPVMNNLNPMWPESYLELSALTGGSNSDDEAPQKFRLAVYDYEKTGNHVFMGDAKLTMDDLVDAAAAVADNDDDKALVLHKNGNETGKIVVCMANVEKPIIQEEPIIQEQATEESVEIAAASVGAARDKEEHDIQVTPLVNKSRGLAISVEEEPDIVVASQSEMLQAEDVDMARIAPTFANYMAGGCEIHAICAIDATSKNGDPRQPTSLHYFRDKNPYQDALESLVTILAKYDSDQKYPVYGFGAKVDGGGGQSSVSHCFPFGSAPLHDGVDGVLSIYDQTFKSGIVMSSPRDFSEVIRTATKDAKERLENGHAYSVLLLFTSGAPSDMSKTMEALKEADDAPLSIVIVGVSGSDGNSSDFDSLSQLEQPDNVRFVSYAKYKDDRDALTEAALDQIPKQLEEYFATRQIYPNPEQEGQDEIVVQPYDENEEIVVPMQFSSSGKIEVTGDVETPTADNNNQQPSGSSGEEAQTNVAKVMELGQKVWNKAKKSKQFGRIRRKVTVEVKRRIKKDFPQARFLL